MIAMVAHAQSSFDQLGDPLRRPQFGPIAVGHSPLDQKTNESLLLLPTQFRRSTRRRLRLQCIPAARSQRVPPTKYATGVTTDPPRDLMERQPLLEKIYNLSTPFFQQARRASWSHSGTPFRDAWIILHYLCVCQ